MDCQ